MWLGEFDLSSVVDFAFTTRNGSGVPTALSGGTISVYKSNSTTETTTGVTLTASFDSVVGLNHVRVDTSADGTFYATATDFRVVITAGTVGGTSVVGEVVAHFTIRNRAGLKPATAGRTLVVDASGLADANTVKVGPTGSGTAQTARDLGNALPAAAPNANGGLPILSSSGTTLGYTVTTLTTYTGNTPQTGDAFARLGAPAGASHAADVAAVKTDTAAIKTKTDQLTFTNANKVDASVLAMASNVITAASIASGAFVAAVWDGAISGHTTAGTFGAALSAAGGAGDPWSTALPGAYAAGTAGFILGNSTSTVGPGSIEFTVTINDDMSNPLDGAEVWVSTDSVGANVIAGTLHTNASGQATFLLDAGSYFLWVSHSGYNRDNPTAFTVT